jgi:hypothetical protein
MVFIIPITIKDTHHHAKEYESSSSGTKITAASQICLICQFEFIHFISTQQVQFYQPVISLKNQELLAPKFRVSFSSFSHRAPPIC